jgi:Fe-S oxidoreductase
MATLEEEHCTRGRARLLWEMLNGAELEKGWKSDAVYGALDLCLSCKGCKHDCPVNVDMATYKAEFLSHYYQGRLRPRHAYAFGLIHVWSGLGSWMPGLVNAVTHLPGVSRLAKWLVGMEPARKAPPLARQTFKEWFRNRPQRRTGPPVLLWADTFNNYYHPDVARAAVEVLEDAGFRVEVPMANLCCGRPLYDYGFLSMAEKWIEQILVELQEPIRKGTPMVVLEPSCCAVFRDELTNLFPNNADAEKLRTQTYVLSEFLVKKAPGYRLKPMNRKALVHGHCHQKAIMGFKEEEEILKKLGLEFEMPEPGCCGMAGAFGFERGDHYDVSIKCGERVLLPAVRKASDQQIIIADGFSCREQISERTDRVPLHLAQVIQMAMHEGGARSIVERPETPVVRARRKDLRRGYVNAALAVGGTALAGWLAWNWAKGSRRGIETSKSVNRR